MAKELKDHLAEIYDLFFIPGSEKPAYRDEEFKDEKVFILNQLRNPQHISLDEMIAFFKEHKKFREYILALAKDSPDLNLTEAVKIFKLNIHPSHETKSESKAESPAAPRAEEAERKRKPKIEIFNTLGYLRLLYTLFVLHSTHGPVYKDDKFIEEKNFLRGLLENNRPISIDVFNNLFAENKKFKEYILELAKDSPDPNMTAALEGLKLIDSSELETKNESKMMPDEDDEEEIKDEELKEEEFDIEGRDLPHRFVPRQRGKDVWFGKWSLMDEYAMSLCEDMEFKNCNMLHLIFEEAAKPEQITRMLKAVEKNPNITALQIWIKYTISPDCIRAIITGINGNRHLRKLEFQADNIYFRNKNSRGFSEIDCMNYEKQLKNLPLITNSHLAVVEVHGAIFSWPKYLLSPTLQCEELVVGEETHSDRWQQLDFTLLPCDAKILNIETFQYRVEKHEEHKEVLIKYLTKCAHLKALNFGLVNIKPDDKKQINLDENRRNFIDLIREVVVYAPQIQIVAIEFSYSEYNVPASIDARQEVEIGEIASRELKAANQLIRKEQERMKIVGLAQLKLLLAGHPIDIPGVFQIFTGYYYDKKPIQLVRKINRSTLDAFLSPELWTPLPVAESKSLPGSEIRTCDLTIEKLSEVAKQICPNVVFADTRIFIVEIKELVNRMLSISMQPTTKKILENLQKKIAAAEEPDGIRVLYDEFVAANKRFAPIKNQGFAGLWKHPDNGLIKKVFDVAFNRVQERFGIPVLKI